MLNIQHLLLMVIAITSFSISANTVKRPNIVIMIADDISAQDIALYGHATIKTPNIDKLASKAVTFDNAYLTVSSCSPSRSSILTGRYPHNTGAPELHSELPDTTILLPKLLKIMATLLHKRVNGTLVRKHLSSLVWH